MFGNILVGGGNVYILAATLGGSGSMTANSAPTISIQNAGIDFLELSNLAISGISGGTIIFTGAATRSTATGTLTFSHSSTQIQALTPSIIIDASYNTTNVLTGQPVDQTGHNLTTTPDIYLNGTVTNVNGILDVTDQLGNLVASQSINVATFEATIPNGSFTFNNSAAVEPTAGAVADQWLKTEYMPTSTLQAVEAAATYLGSCTGTGCASLGLSAAWHAVYRLLRLLQRRRPVYNASLVDRRFELQLQRKRYFHGPAAEPLLQGGAPVSAIFLPTGYTYNNTSGPCRP